MRYTKAALLIFGLGLVTGFIVVVGEFFEGERVASAAMALGLVMLPVALFADGHGMAAIRWVAAWFPRGQGRKTRARPRSAAPRRKVSSRVGRPDPDAAERFQALRCCLI